MIQLQRPVYKLPSLFLYQKRDGRNPFAVITQGFGECGPASCPFYKELGLKSHNGIDFLASYIDCFAAHDGEIFKTLDENNSSPTAGYGVYIRHAEGWWTLYFHLSEVSVKVGDKVKAGDKIGVTGNTGKYTTGPHLHLSLYPKDRDRNNGYDGAIDPMPYFNSLTTNDMVDDTMLQKIYQLAFHRDPDAGAQGYLGKDINFVLAELLKSEEHTRYDEVYKAIKKIESL